MARAVDPLATDSVEVTISPGAVRRNVETLRGRLGAGLELAAVVKSDGYGHGMGTAAQSALRAGVRWLVVGKVDEGLALRKALGDVADILVLGPIFTHQAADAVEARLTVCVGHVEVACALDEAARSQGRRTPVHLHVDTGMGRYGFIQMTGAFDRALEVLLPLEGLAIEGVSTHLSESDVPDSDFTTTQMHRFRCSVEHLRARGVHPRWVHAGNSGAAVHFLDSGRETECNLLRIGLAIYGVCPGPEPPGGWDLEPAMSLRCPVADVRDMPEGLPVSYGRTFRTRRASRLALLPMGYADGYPRPCSAGAEVIIRGRRAPVVGLVTMSVTVVDVTDVEGVSVGDGVLLFGRGEDDALLRVEELAAVGGLIPYEVLCQVGRMNRRMVVEEGDEK